MPNEKSWKQAHTLTEKTESNKQASIISGEKTWKQQYILNKLKIITYKWRRMLVGSAQILLNYLN